MSEQAKSNTTPEDVSSTAKNAVPQLPEQLPLGVVTVTYSPGKHISALVDSLPAAAQHGTYLVMADNGSIDGSVEAEEKRAADSGTGNVQLLRTGGNIGYGAAANRGIAELARMRDRGELNPDWVLLVNPDVVFEAGSIDALLQCAQETPRAGAIGPLIQEADGSAYPSARAVPELVSGIGHALLADIWPNNPFSSRYRDDARMDIRREAGWLSGACLLLNWKAFEAIDGFDTRYFMYMEDVDLGDRLGKAGWKNIFCPDAVIHHAQGHSANAHPEITVKAHHDSAYRFMSDRLPGWKWAPMRLVLKVGLFVRGKVIVAAKKRSS